MPVELSDGNRVMTLDECEEFASAVLALADEHPWPEWQSDSARKALRSGALLALNIAEERQMFSTDEHLKALLQALIPYAKTARVTDEFRAAWLRTIEAAEIASR